MLSIRALLLVTLCWALSTRAFVPVLRSNLSHDGVLGTQVATTVSFFSLEQYHEEDGGSSSNNNNNNNNKDHDLDVHSLERTATTSRRHLFTQSAASLAAILTATVLLDDSKAAHAKSYSANARNMERLNEGDLSGGSVYNNNPTTAAGQKRRALQGCKSAVARQQAMALDQQQSKSVLLEKECNQRVLQQGDAEFMLRALRTLDCPAAAYGICTSLPAPP